MIHWLQLAFHRLDTHFCGCLRPALPATAPVAAALAKRPQPPPLEAAQTQRRFLSFVLSLYNSILPHRLHCGSYLCRTRFPHIGHAPACASFGSPSARFPPKGFRLSAVHLCTACSALRAIPSLRSAPLIDIAFGDSSLRSSGDISLRSAEMS